MRIIQFESEQQAASYVIECEMRGKKYTVLGRKSIMIK